MIARLNEKEKENEKAPDCVGKNFRFGQYGAEPDSEIVSHPGKRVCQSNGKKKGYGPDSAGILSGIRPDFQKVKNREKAEEPILVPKRVSGADAEECWLQGGKPVLFLAKSP